MHTRAANGYRLAVALFAWYLVTYVLLPIPAVREGLDESWRAFLTWAMGRHLQFGTEVVFSYGPWGFLMYPRGTISAYPWQVIGRAVLALGTSAGVAYLAATRIRPVMTSWIWAGAIVLLAETSQILPVLLFLLTMPADAERREDRRVILLVAFATGLAACTKFTSFVLIAALLPLLLRKGVRSAAATCVASFLVFWLAAGQGIAGLPAFVRRFLEISAGYSSAMTLGSPASALWPAVVIGALPVIQVARWAAPRRNWTALGYLGWIAICQWIVLRLALVRSDPEHFYQGLVVIGLPSVLLLLALPEDAPADSPAWWKPLYVSLFATALVISVTASLVPIQQRVGIFRESLRLYPSYARQIVSHRANGAAPPVDDAAIDVFPSELSHAIRKGLPLRARPVIQSYSAYTPDLAAMNAAFLEGRDGPRKIYLRVDSIDGRYPALDDSLAWRSLLTRYEPSGFADEYIVFARRERPMQLESRMILDRELQAGESLDIPAAPGSMIWAQVEFRPTVAGRLADLLFRTEQLLLRVDTGQRAEDFVLVPGTAAAGFLLSPEVTTQAAMLELFEAGAGRLYAPDVRRIAIHGGRLASLEFRRTFRVRLFALAQQQPAHDVPGHLLMALGRTLRTERRVGSVEFSPELTVADGEVRLIAGSPSSASIPQPSGGRLRLRYGSGEARSDCPGGVAFRILAADAAGAAKRVLWEAAGLPRSSAEANVDLPPAMGQPLLFFETSPVEASCGGGGAWWSGMRIAP
jgi:hypothetical protein